VKVTTSGQTWQYHAEALKKRVEVHETYRDTYLAREKVAKNQWESEKSKQARSDAMMKLKHEWARAGKPLSHLNRQDLSMQSQIALRGLLECKDAMRSKEAHWYLSDSNYTSSLAESIDAKTKCVDDFRTKVFWSLLQTLRSVPLRSMPNEHHDELRDSAVVAFEMSDKELRCGALHRVLQFQRLHTQNRIFQQAVEHALRLNCSASVTIPFVQKILQELPAYKRTWSKQIPASHTSDLAHQILAHVVQISMCELLSTLDRQAIQVLLDEDTKRKVVALQRDELSAGRPFSEAVTTLEQIGKRLQGSSSPEDSCELPIELLNSDRKLLHDLCHSHYQLSCTEHKVQYKEVECNVPAGEATVEALVSETSESAMLMWDYENNPGKEYFRVEGNTVTYLDGAPDYCNVLSASPITAGRHAFKFVMHKIGDEQWCGVTSDLSLAGTRTSLRQRAQCWTYYCGRRNGNEGMLSVEEEETKELEHIKDGDIIGIIIDFNQRMLEFSRNGEFQASCEFRSDVKQLYLITELDSCNDRVELVAETSIDTCRRLVLTCSNIRDGTTTQGKENSISTDLAHNTVSDASLDQNKVPGLHVELCKPERQCNLCLAAQEQLEGALLSGLVCDIGAVLREGAYKVADLQYHRQVLVIFKEKVDTILPAVTEDGGIFARVERALSCLPAALLAEPQCCLRMMAAVSCLTVASNNLPLDKCYATLPLGSCFLVPPFEELGDTPQMDTPHLLRCIELLELGTAALDVQNQKLLVWEDKHPDVLLSEDLSLATGGNKRNAVGTQLEMGSIVFTLVSFKGDVMVGVALDGFDFDTMDYSSTSAILADSEGGGVPRIRGKGRNELSLREMGVGRSGLKEKDTIRVEYDGASVEFFVNDDAEAWFKVEDVTGAVRPFVHFFASSNAIVQMTGHSLAQKVRSSETKKQQLTMDRATESLPLASISKMSSWEARVFGCMCVSTYTLSSPLGEISLQRLAAGELSDLTLTESECTGREAAFLAHFIARSCRHQVSCLMAQSLLFRVAGLCRFFFSFCKTL